MSLALPQEWRVVSTKMMTADPQALTAQMSPQPLMIMMMMPLTKPRPYGTTHLLCLRMMMMRMMMLVLTTMSTLTMELTLKSTMTNMRAVKRMIPLMLAPAPARHLTVIWIVTLRCCLAQR
jgi:hypothetical protein